MRKRPRAKEDAFLDPSEWAAFAKRFGLKGKQLPVVQLIYAGRERKNIATELKMKPGTVDSHCARIHKKLGARHDRDVLRTVFAFILDLRGLDRPRARKKRV